MEELKIDYSFDLEDFKTIENIEHTYFLDRNISKAEDVFEWYKKNNLSCIGLRNSDNRIIASVNIVPLCEETFNKIYNNEMNEADIKYNEVQEYESNNTYNIYLSSISIDKKYINNYRVIKTLLIGCIDLFNKLINQNINIKKVMADASTIHGEKICQKLLNMEYVIDTEHGSKVYCIDGEIFIKNAEKLNKKFIKK